LVIEETVRFLNSVENYDTDVYVYRAKDVLHFFHTRLIKTNLDKESKQKLIDILVPVWKQVKHKELVRKSLRNDGRFITSLGSNDTLNSYIAYVVPIKQVLGKAEKKRQTLTGKIRQNKVAYKVLRPPVHVLRKVNKLVSKVLS
jgi:hypothetical protein